MKNETPKTFIKVLDPEVAKALIEKGYTPVKEQKIYCFPYDIELLAMLQKEYASNTIVIENTLTF